MLIADAALRGMAGSLLAMLVLVLVRDARGSWSGRLGAVLAIGAGAYLLCSQPAFRAWAGVLWWTVLPFCLVNPALFWMFARALFDDDYRPGRPDLAAMAALLSAGLARVIGQAALPGWLDWATLVSYQGGILALIGHALWCALHGRGDDLIEARRRFRAVFVVGIGGYMAVIAVSEMLLHDSVPPAWLVALNPAAIALIAGAALMRGIRLRHDELVGQLLLPPAPAEAVDPADRALLERLTKAMTEEAAYREEGLTIAALARRLAAPEYRLRRLINRQLGYRNFSAFLNGYRIDEAKAALLDPARRREPILTIALALGFGSIGPFNRAFKAATGLTPSAYRQAEPPSCRPPELSAGGGGA